MAKIRQYLRNWLIAFLLPRPLIGFFFLPRYLFHWFKYSIAAKGQKVGLLDLHPCLGDWTTHTPFDAHYFYQAAWLSRQIAEARPVSHTDIGSDTKLIGIISAFIPVRFLDYRPLQVSIDGLTCGKADLVSLDIKELSISSLSCLHVVEHIGLGRYGDAIDPKGSVKALGELQKVVAAGGYLYLSVPVGRERVCFNAHRVFAAETILAILPQMSLKSFSLVDDAGKYHPDCALSEANGLEYGCGMFVFEKIGQKVG